MKTPRSFDGFTITELLVVVVLVGVLAVIAIPSFTDLLNRRRVQAVAAELSTDLAYARSQAGLRPASLGVKFSSNATQTCYTVFVDGTVGSCDCRRGQGSACLIDPVEIKTTQVAKSLGVELTATTSSGAWPGNVANTLKFISPQMNASPGDTRIVVRGRNSKVEVRVNPMGRISTCTPDNSMPGVPAC